MLSYWIRVLAALIVMPWLATGATADESVPIVERLTPVAPGNYLSGVDLGAAAHDFLTASGKLDHLGNYDVKVGQIANEGAETTIFFNLRIDGRRVLEHAIFLVVDTKTWAVHAFSNRATRRASKTGKVTLQESLEKRFGARPRIEGNPEAVYFVDMEEVLRSAWLAEIRIGDLRRQLVVDTRGTVHFDMVVDSGVPVAVRGLPTKTEDLVRPFLSKSLVPGSTNDFNLSFGVGPSGPQHVEGWRISSQTADSSGIPNFADASFVTQIPETPGATRIVRVWVSEKTWWWVQSCGFPLGCGPPSNPVSTEPFTIAPPPDGGDQL